MLGKLYNLWCGFVGRWTVKVDVTKSIDEDTGEVAALPAIRTKGDATPEDVGKSRSKRLRLGQGIRSGDKKPVDQWRAREHLQEMPGSVTSRSSSDALNSSTCSLLSDVSVHTAREAGSPSTADLERALVDKSI